MTIGRIAWVGTNAVLAAVLSPACAVCGRVLDAPVSGPVCEACWSAVHVLTPPLCGRCGHPLPTASGTLMSRHPAGVPDEPCTACPDLTALAVLRAAGAYEGTLREVLHALKYGGRRSLARRLARLVTDRCSTVLAGADAVVPVPLHIGRRWTRGFNQADLLARSLGLPVWRVLRRRRATPPQASLDAASRRSNLVHAFALARPARLTSRRVAGRTIVLVDDVCTTGATLDACARVLKAAGAAEVRAVAVARTVRHLHPVLAPGRPHAVDCDIPRP